jgi:hypothetical protein
MRLGITAEMSNAMSWSSVQQTVTIPADATRATLRFWWQRGTEETPLSASAAQTLLPQAAETGEGFSRVELTYDQDLHEIMLLNGANPQEVVAILARGCADDGDWVEVEYDLLPWRGRSLVLYWNAFNEGTGGRTWMYLDDVSLEVCRPG